MTDHSLDRLSEQVAALDTTLGACLNAMAAGQDAGPSEGEGWADAPADTAAPLQIAEQLAALRTQLDQMSSQPDGGAELHAKLDALDQRLSSFETRLSDLAAPPKPDLSDQREIMARFTTAMATIGRRQEEAVTRLETQLQSAHDRLEQQISTLEQTAPQPQHTEPVVEQETEQEAELDVVEDSCHDSAPEIAPATGSDTEPETAQAETTPQPGTEPEGTEMDAPSAEGEDPAPAAAATPEDPSEPPEPTALPDPSAQDPQIAEHLASLRTLLDQMSSQNNDGAELHSKLDALDQRLVQFETQLSDIAMPPKLDLGDQRDIMARFTTAMATIERRQEDAIECLGEHLQSAHERIDQQVTALEQAAEEGRQTRQMLDSYSATFKTHIREAIDKVAGQNVPEADTLAQQVATALQSALADQGASDVQEASSIADDLMRGIRVAVAEVVADTARQRQTDAQAPAQACEK